MMSSEKSLVQAASNCPSPVIMPEIMSVIMARVVDDQVPRYSDIDIDLRFRFSVSKPT